MHTRYTGLWPEIRVVKVTGPNRFDLVEANSADLRQSVVDIIVKPWSGSAVAQW